MEVNKEQAEKCRDLGAEALRSGQYARAIKFLNKSLQLYPLPGVKALLGQAERKVNEAENGGSASSQSAAAPQSQPRAAARSASNVSNASEASNTGADGRAYSDEQVRIVKQVLRSKEGGRGAHYRVLGVESSATENDLKKAYRRLALKLHPDKNSAPHADEAFKAVGLAYGTLSDPQKRTIYDQYGEEDPDNRGGGGAAARAGGVHFRRGEEVSPEDIFNMFFGGGMPMGGAPGFHVYTNGFGGGFGPGAQFRQRQQARPREPQEREEQMRGLGSLVQILPLLVILLLSFFNSGSESGNTGNRYFSLTHTAPFVNPLQTKLTKVKDIPYFVTDQFMRSFHRDRYQLAQIERMVEKSYQQYLVSECKKQKMYKNQLERAAQRAQPDEREREMKKAKAFELSRCQELEDLFPHRERHSVHSAYGRR